MPRQFQREAGILGDQRSRERAEGFEGHRNVLDQGDAWPRVAQEWQMLIDKAAREVHPRGIAPVQGGRRCPYGDGDRGEPRSARGYVPRRHGRGDGRRDLRARRLGGQEHRPLAYTVPGLSRAVHHHASIQVNPIDDATSEIATSPTSCPTPSPSSAPASTKPTSTTRPRWSSAAGRRGESGEISGSRLSDRKSTAQATPGREGSRGQE